MEYDLEDFGKVCLMPRLSLSELLAIGGLVRAVCERSSDVMLVCKRDHVSSIRCLFADLRTALRFKFVDSWAGHQTVLDEVEALGYKIIPLPTFRETCPYALLGLDPGLRTERFALTRSQDGEKQLHDAVVRAVGPTYVVVHEDHTRRIRRELLPAGLAVVDVRDPKFRTSSIFDWIRVIDHAVHFHGIDSCFMLMADMLALRARKYCHAYASPTTSATRYVDVITIWS